MALRALLLAAAITAAACRPQGPAPAPVPVPSNAETVASDGTQQGGQQQPPAAAPAEAEAAEALNMTAGSEDEGATVTISYPPPTTVQECRRELHDARLRAIKAQQNICPTVFRYTDCIRGLGLAESATLVALAYSAGMGCTCANLLPQLSNARSPLGHRFGRPQPQEHTWAIRAAELVLAHKPLMCSPNYDSKNAENATHGDGHQDDPWLSELYHELAWRSAALNKTANTTAYMALASGVGATPKEPIARGLAAPRAYLQALGSRALER